MVSESGNNAQCQPADVPTSNMTIPPPPHVNPSEKFERPAFSRGRDNAELSSEIRISHNDAIYSQTGIGNDGRSCNDKCAGHTDTNDDIVNPCDTEYVLDRPEEDRNDCRSTNDVLEILRDVAKELGASRIRLCKCTART